MNDLTKYDNQVIGFWDSTKIPLDIICNGFSIKETILEVLHNHNSAFHLHLSMDKLEEISEEMKEAFAVKLGLKQGER